MHGFRRKLTAWLHVDEPPHRVALAFGVGVFIAFSPTHGLHTVSAVLCSWAFRLNFIVLMAGNLLNNPWTIVPIVAASWWTGLTVTGMEPAPWPSWRSADPAVLYDTVASSMVAFLIGGFLLSVAGGLAGYACAYLALHVRRRSTAVRPARSEESGVA